MGTDPKAIEPDARARREPWTSPLPEEAHDEDLEILLPRAEGEDADFEAIEMTHRGINTPR